MAQQTAQSVTATPGRIHSFSAKTAAPVVVPILGRTTSSGQAAGAISILTPVLSSSSDQDQVRWIRSLTASFDELSTQVATIDIDGRLTALENTTEITADYTTLGLYSHEIIICTNSGGIAVTLHALTGNDKVTVIRAGTGAVTVDGDASNIVGSGTYVIASQYDVAALIASSTEWLLI